MAGKTRLMKLIGIIEQCLLLIIWLVLIMGLFFPWEHFVNPQGDLLLLLGLLKLPLLLRGHMTQTLLNVAPICSRVQSPRYLGTLGTTKSSKSLIGGGKLKGAL